MPSYHLGLLSDMVPSPVDSSTELPALVSGSILFIIVIFIIPPNMKSKARSAQLLRIIRPVCVLESVTMKEDHRSSIEQRMVP